MQVHRRIAWVVLCGLLSAQILLIRPSVSWPNITIGQVGVAEKTESVVHPKTVHQALLASYKTDEKSGIIFTGDVLLARNVEYLMEREGTRYPFRGLSLTTLLDGAAVVGNFEASMPLQHMPTPALQMRFSVNLSVLPALTEAGFTHFSLANNHSFDYGEEGFRHAWASLYNQGFVPFGSGKAIAKESVTYVNTQSGRVALVGIHASTVVPSRTTLKELLQHAGRQSDIQIIYIHWGSEYKLVHNQVQEELAITLVSYGADLIIGHHPHVVQDVGVIDSVPVFYSLGNYIFDQYFEQSVQEGLVLSLALDGPVPEVRLHPVSSLGTLSQPALMSEKKSAAFLDDLATRSDDELKQAIQAGVFQLPQLVAQSQKMAIMVR